MRNHNRAVFLDRDGVINELVYYPDIGVFDSPHTMELFHVLPKIGDAVRLLKEAGFKLVVISNQPGIAKGRFTETTLNDMDQKMIGELAKYGACFNGIYYCLHHPEGTNSRYRVECECRKPKPGLLLHAANELGINLRDSYMIGDNLTDVKAGKRAGCQTILLRRFKCETCRLMEDQDSRPDIVTSDLWTAAQIILGCSSPLDKISKPE